jgi:hypothetical protein
MVRGAGRIALLYALFATLATAANLLTQMLVILLYHGPMAVEASIAIGTAAGLPVKYLLEKRHIFAFESEGLAHDGQLFLLYSFMGLFTTAIFWGIEYLFHILFNSDWMRYLGGAIGLTLGYFIKYHIDKQFVFVNRPAVGV